MSTQEHKWRKKYGMTSQMSDEEMSFRDGNQMLIKFKKLSPTHQHLLGHSTLWTIHEKKNEWMVKK